MMKTMMENLTEIMRASFEKQTDVLHHEIFSLKDTLDQERQKRKKLEKENENLQADMTQIRREMQCLNDRLDDYDQNTRNSDVVFDNINREEVKDVRDFTTKLVNDALMGKVLDKNDLKKATIIKNKRNPQKMSIIATLCSETDKKSIFTQKKLFRAKNVYVKENLTQQRFRLFKDVKAFAEENNVKYTWTRSGVIHLRKTDASPVFSVRTIGDLARLHVSELRNSV